MFTDELLKALDRENGLMGAVLDVTSPEPLPDGHALFTHPRVLLTPHLSGESEGEFSTAAEICALNLQRLENGERLLNVVDYSKGY